MATLDSEGRVESADTLGATWSLFRPRLALAVANDGRTAVMGGFDGVAELAGSSFTSRGRRDLFVLVSGP